MTTTLPGGLMQGQKNRNPHRFKLTNPEYTPTCERLRSSLVAEIKCEDIGIRRYSVFNPLEQLFKNHSAMKAGTST